MQRNFLRSVSSIVCVGLGLTASFQLSAGAAPTPAAPATTAPDFSKVQIRTTRVVGDLYALEGQGGTVSVLAGADGALIIDSQFAPLTEKLIAAIRGFTQAPLRFLVDTHVHGDHVGGNANFARAGATIIAHDNVRTRLRYPPATASGAPGTPAAAEALPVITFDNTTSLHVNGQTVRLSAVPASHTDGDVLVEIPGLDVLITGDFYRTVGYPTADRNNGGSFRGIVDALGVAIGKAGPRTIVVPGHGTISNRAGLIEQRDLLVDVIAKVQQALRAGMSIEQVLAARPTAAYDDRIVQGAQQAERFVRGLYAELAERR